MGAPLPLWLGAADRLNGHTLNVDSGIIPPDEGRVKELRMRMIFPDCEEGEYNGGRV
jgi:hypothetical protein